MQQVHRCSDGQWICASMTQPQQYQRFVEAVGLPEQAAFHAQQGSLLEVRSASWTSERQN